MPAARVLKTEGKVVYIGAVDPDEEPQPLTLKRAQTAKHWPGKKRVVPCNQHTGFCMSISPMNHRSWCVRVRKPGGRGRLKTIGDVPMGKNAGMPWAKAFKKYEYWRGLARNDGVDISVRAQKRKATANGMTVEQAHEGYLFAKGWIPCAKEDPGAHKAYGDSYWKLRKPAPAVVRAWGSVRAYCYSMKLLVEVFGANRDIWDENDDTQISGQECLDGYDKICQLAYEKRGTDGVASAFNAMNYLTIIWGFHQAARKTKLTCPVTALQQQHKMVPPGKRTRRLDDETLYRWWQALEQIPVGNGMQSTAAVWRLYLIAVLLLGCRKTEMLQLRWEWVDLNKQVINFPSWVVKNRHPDGQACPIGDWLTTQLKAHKKTQDGTEYVFAYPEDTRYAGLPLRFTTHVVKTLRKALKLKWSVHDLRRTYSTLAAEIGVNEFVLAALLNHKKKTVTQGYPQITVKQMRPWQQKIEDQILELARGKTPQLKEAVNG